MKFFLIMAAFPKFGLFNFLTNNPAALIPTVVPSVVFAQVVDIKAVAWILFGMFAADLVTGIVASYIEWRDRPENKDRWFFGRGEGFQSDKFKKMFFKAIVYAGLPLILIQFQAVLMLKNFKYNTLSDAEFEWATIAMIVFCLNEGFSIFHENLPRCGFNLWKEIKRMTGFYKEVKKELKDE